MKKILLFSLILFIELFTSVQKVSAMPEAFKDENFYKCIIDSYNDEYNENLSYNDDLSEEDLQKIYRLDCSIPFKYKDESRKINNILGIEKLINVWQLQMYGNNISEIDLSNNIKLKEVDFRVNNIKNVDLSKNSKLTKISFTSNNISEIDLSNNVNLNDLDLANNNISEIDLSNNVNLNYLNLANNNISEIDLSNNVNLYTINISYNKLKFLDFNKNDKITRIVATDNNLNKINLSNNLKLEELLLSFNELKDLNLYNNINLQEISVNSNKIKSLNLCNNKSLQKIFTYYEDITDYIINNNSNLEINATHGVHGTGYGSLGKNLQYNSLNKNILDINEEGKINIINSGKATIEIKDIKNYLILFDVVNECPGDQNNVVDIIAKTEQTIKNPSTSDINIAIIGVVTLITLTGVIVSVRRLKKLSK